MTTTPASQYPVIPLPAGADSGDDWTTSHRYKDCLHRIVWRGPKGTVAPDERSVESEELRVSLAATQFVDGTIDDGTVLEPPFIYIDKGTRVSLPLTSTQARELIPLLVEAVDQIDQWEAGTAPA